MPDADGNFASRAEVHVRNASFELFKPCYHVVGIHYEDKVSQVAQGKTRPQPPVRSTVGELGELRLDLIQVIAHTGVGGFQSSSWSRIRASPRLTRLRTTISEQCSEAAIS